MGVCNACAWTTKGVWHHFWSFWAVFGLLWAPKDQSGRLKCKHASSISPQINTRTRMFTFGPGVYSLWGLKPRKRCLVNTFSRLSPQMCVFLAVLFGRKTRLTVEQRTPCLRDASTPTCKRRLLLCHCGTCASFCPPFAPLVGPCPAGCLVWGQNEQQEMFGVFFCSYMWLPDARVFHCLRTMVVRGTTNSWS